MVPYRSGKISHYPTLFLTSAPNMIQNSLMLPKSTKLFFISMKMLTGLRGSNHRMTRELLIGLPIPAPDTPSHLFWRTVSHYWLVIVVKEKRTKVAWIVTTYLVETYLGQLESVVVAFHKSQYQCEWIDRCEGE